MNATVLFGYRLSAVGYRRELQTNGRRWIGEWAAAVVVAIVLSSGRVGIGQAYLETPYPTASNSGYPTTTYPTAILPASPWGGTAVPEPVLHQPAAEGFYSQPGTSQPGTSQPGTSRPGTSRPGTSRPGTSRPGWPGYVEASGAVAVGPPMAVEGAPLTPAAAVTGSTAFDPNIRLAQAPSLGDQSLLLNKEEQAAADSLLPPGTRDGVFQKAKFSATYLPRLENDSLGFTDLRSSLVFGLPFFTRETPIVIEPEYRVRFLERPTPAIADLPPRLHDVATEFRHFRRLSDRWIFDSAVTVGWYADDHSFDSSDAFRVTGRALGVYEASDVWKWVFGVAYLNRAGASVLPVAGLAYDTDTVKYEMVFPRPRAAWLLPGSVVDLDEQWVYVMGEFGGGVWAINRPATNTPDTLTARDIRILFGYERKIVGGVSSKFEFGYVFARELEFDSGAPPEISLDDTILFRAGISY